MKNSQKRNQKTSKYIKIAVLCVSFIVIICMMFLIYNDMKDKKHHTADDSADNKEYSSIEVDGKDYNYNTGLINILFKTIYKKKSAKWRGDYLRNKHIFHQIGNNVHLWGGGYPRTHI